jgi:hypothetical protein
MQRVLIVGMGFVLEEAVESLLTAERDLQVSDLIFTDESNFVQDILRTRPDVILFHEAGALTQGRIFELLRAIPTEETLRITILRTSNNTIDLLERRTIRAAQRSDLINFVRGHQS